MPDNGLRFACQAGCTECCRQHGFVYLAEEDVPRIAAYLGLSPEEFERRHIYRTKNLRRLRTPRNALCRFLEAGGCSIHAVKPVQCRAFPFWPEMVNSRRAWNKTAQWCPGMGKGELVNIEAAREIADGMSKVYPSLYPAKP